MSITFDDPPLSEVTLGRTFLPRADILIPHFGLFWTLVRQQFPQVAHAPPIFMADEPQPGLEDGLLPRIWLLSADSSTLVQLQQSRFHFNWRQSQTGEKRSYVRFPAIKSECLRLWGLFEKLVQEETGQPLQPIGSELTYINFVVDEPTVEKLDLAERVLRDPVWARHPRDLPVPSQISSSYGFEMPRGRGVLQVVATTGQRRGGEPALRLELTARGRHSADLPFEQWADEAHDFLVSAFKDLTQPAMHKLWKLREV